MSVQRVAPAASRQDIYAGQWGGGGGGDKIMERRKGVD